MLNISIADACSSVRWTALATTTAILLWSGPSFAQATASAPIRLAQSTYDPQRPFGRDPPPTPAPAPRRTRADYPPEVWLAATTPARSAPLPAPGAPVYYEVAEGDMGITRNLALDLGPCPTGADADGWAGGLDASKNPIITTIIRCGQRTLYFSNISKTFAQTQALFSNTIPPRGPKIDSQTIRRVSLASPEEWKALLARAEAVELAKRSAATAPAAPSAKPQVASASPAKRVAKIAPNTLAGSPTPDDVLLVSDSYNAKYLGYKLNGVPGVLISSSMIGEVSRTTRTIDRLGCRRTAPNRYQCTYTMSSNLTAGTDGSWASLVGAYQVNVEGSGSKTDTHTEEFVNQGGWSSPTMETRVRQAAADIQDAQRRNNNNNAGKDSLGRTCQVYNDPYLGSQWDCRW